MKKENCNIEIYGDVIDKTLKERFQSQGGHFLIENKENEKNIENDQAGEEIQAKKNIRKKQMKLEYVRKLEFEKTIFAKN